jgi:hypothetical protein
MGSVKSLVAVGSVARGAYLNRIPDVLLKSQYFESIGTRTLSSEQRLMLAVLADAINVLGDYRVSPNRRKRNSFNEASSWVFANGITSPLSFDHVCDALSVDAESLRRRLSDLVSEHGSTLHKLRLKKMGKRLGPTITRVRRR